MFPSLPSDPVTGRLYR